MRNRDTINFAVRMMELPLPETLAFLPVSSSELVLISKGADLQTVAEIVSLSGYVATVYPKQNSIVVRKQPESDVWTVEEILAREG